MNCQLEPAENPVAKILLVVTGEDAEVYIDEVFNPDEQLPPPPPGDNNENPPNPPNNVNNNRGLAHPIFRLSIPKMLPFFGRFRNFELNSRVLLREKLDVLAYSIPRFGASHFNQLGLPETTGTPTMLITMQTTTRQTTTTTTIMQITSLTTIPK
jgi:hypothetical protein